MSRSKGFVSTVLSNRKVRFIGGGLLVVLALFMVGSRLNNKSNKVTQLASTALSNPGQNSDGAVLASTEVNQTIEIPTGKGKATIKYTVTSAELTKSIIIQGQKASAKDGKQFLILNLKLSNDSENRIKIDARDYVRLSVNGSGDRLAPAIYNDIEVQPISDQVTRVGFSVFETDTDYLLYLGEISEDKIEIPLHFE